MSIAQRRLSYMGLTKTDTWIAQQTGIPRSTVGFVRRGERALPSQYDYDLRLGYQRVAYNKLREEGMNTDQSRKFSSYSPESSSLKQMIMKDIVNGSTMNACIQEKLRLEKEGIFVEMKDIWDSMHDQVVEGFQTDIGGTLDEWEKY